MCKTRTVRPKIQRSWPVINGFNSMPAAKLASSEEKRGPRWMANCCNGLSMEVFPGPAEQISKVVITLQQCRKMGNLEIAKHMHLHLCNNMLEAHPNVGNFIVPMFVKCGSISDAQEAFNRLYHRNEHSWTSLILGYLHCGQLQHAFNLYHDMENDGVYPSAHTVGALLKACAIMRDLERGKQMHDKIRESKFRNNYFVGNAVVHMYSKCGSLAEAQEAFDNLSVRDVISWTAIIAGYVEHGCNEKALNCFQKMQLQEVFPDAATFLCSLKACCNLGALNKGREIHSEIVKERLEKDTFLDNTLVDMYAKCGSLVESQIVFDQLLTWDAVSWTALLAGYAEHGPAKALKVFELMQLQGISPDVITFVCSLKACSSLQAIHKGREIHSGIVQAGLEANIFIGNILIDMYAKCGSLEEAQIIFDKLPVKDAISWTALLCGYTEIGLSLEALNCFDKMQLEDVTAEVGLFSYALKACGALGAIVKGREIHTQVVKSGLHRDLFLGNSLLKMYNACGSLGEAWEVFDNLPVRDAVSWTGIIVGCLEYGIDRQMIKFLECMQLEGVSPDVDTLVFSLKACGNTGAIEKGREIHTAITQQDFERDFFICNSLLDMYAKCGSMVEARKLFDKLSVRDVGSWTILIAGYVENGNALEALNCFDNMKVEGIFPNVVTFVCTLKACTTIEDIDKGQQMHAEIQQKGLQTNPLIVGSLIDMYAKSGLLLKAREVFNMSLAHSDVSWTALIAAYAECGSPQEVLKCFDEMQIEGISPNPVIYVCSLKACSTIGAIDKGREIHIQIAKKEFEENIFVGNSLINMYTKCGSLLDARQVFNKLSVQDTVTWNAMISGYAMNHENKLAIQCFEEMQVQGSTPDATTFACLLTACSRASLVTMGQEYFKLMGEYGIKPMIDHYACMVDLLARSGQLYMAEKLLKTMPYSSSSEAWTALLSSCKIYADLEVGLRSFHHLVQMNSEDAASYVLMANIYADAGRRDDANRIEELKKYAMEGTCKGGNRSEQGGVRVSCRQYVA